jgi:hypothetical protein
MSEVVEVLVPSPVSVVEVLIPGPQGPGGSGSAFTFTQASAATTWTINHNLGVRPVVTVLSVGGMEVEAEVTHTSINQTVVNFVTATAGTARLV